MKEPIHSSRWPQLAKWWDTATITNPTEVAAVAKRLVGAKARYQSVEASTGVPWWLIAAIHEREASQGWDKQLAQGDPLNRSQQERAHHGAIRHVGRGRGRSSQT